MDKRRRVDLPFRDLLEVQRKETEDHYEAWRRAMVQYHHQHGEHDAASTIAASKAEVPLPLPESVLTNKKPGPDGIPMIHETLPPINAAGLNHILSQCKPNDPKAQEIMKKNTARLVECGLVDKLGPQQPSQSPAAEATPPPPSPPKLSKPFDEPEEERQTDLSRVQAAHRRFWAAMGGSPKDM